MRNIYIFLFNGFSDWEISYLTPEIHKNSNFNLFFLSTNGTPVKSMGGLEVSNVSAISDVNTEDIDMLILPGGIAWEKGENDHIKSLVLQLAGANKNIAAICAATTFIAQLGLLDNVKHTSNDLNYLKNFASNYAGEHNYQNTMATTHQNIITANGIAAIEFACEIFKLLELNTPQNIEKWFQLFKNGIWSE